MIQIPGKYSKVWYKERKSGFQRTELISFFLLVMNLRIMDGYIPEGILWVGLAIIKGYKPGILMILRKYYVDDGESIMTTAKFKDNAFELFNILHIISSKF